MRCILLVTPQVHKNMLRTCNSVVVVISSKLKMNGVGTSVMHTGS